MNDTKKMSLLAEAVSQALGSPGQTPQPLHDPELQKYLESGRTKLAFQKRYVENFVYNFRHLYDAMSESAHSSRDFNAEMQLCDGGAIITFKTCDFTPKGEPFLTDAASNDAVFAAFFAEFRNDNMPGLEYSANAGIYKIVVTHPAALVFLLESYMEKNNLACVDDPIENIVNVGPQPLNDTACELLPYMPAMTFLSAEYAYSTSLMAKQADVLPFSLLQMKGLLYAGLGQECPREMGRYMPV